MPMNGFPQDVEIWIARGDVAQKLADRPSREGTPITGVEPGPRGYRWRADQPATIVWAEALDGGDSKNTVPFRDKVLALAAPFTGQPIESRRPSGATASIAFTDKGIGLLTEIDRASRRTRTWILEAGRRSRASCGIASRTPRTTIPARRSRGATAATGAAAADAAATAARRSCRTATSSTSPASARRQNGDRPFLDRLNLKTLKTERAVPLGRRIATKRSSRR